MGGLGSHAEIRGWGQVGIGGQVRWQKDSSEKKHQSSDQRHRDYNADILTSLKAVKSSNRNRHPTYNLSHIVHQPPCTAPGIMSLYSPTVGQWQSRTLANNLLGNLLDDLAVVGEDNLVDMEGGLDGVGLVVDPLELLEGAALRLDTVESIC
jgi:hypothetical protein